MEMIFLNYRVAYEKNTGRIHFIPTTLVNDCEITLIDNSDFLVCIIFWIRLLKAYYPLGLNIEEEL